MEYTIIIGIIVGIAFFFVQRSKKKQSEKSEVEITSQLEKDKKRTKQAALHFFLSIILTASFIFMLDSSLGDFALVACAVSGLYFLVACVFLLYYVLKK